MYQYHGTLARQLNHVYQNSGLRCFGFNQMKLSQFGNKNAQRANLDYFNAYLFLKCYEVYVHLFHLGHYMKGIEPPAYWYDSSVAEGYHGLLDSILYSGYNPVIYLSYRFGRFYHQSQVYNHVYDYKLSQSDFEHYAGKFVQYLRRQHQDFYYFSGNPVLDLAYVYFQNMFVKYVSPSVATISDVEWNINTEWEQMQKLLRMSDTAFLNYFGHRRLPIERKLIRAWNPNAIYMELGIPMEPLTFSWLSPRIIGFTHGLSVNLFGIEDYLSHELEIPSYELYGIKCGKEIYSTLRKLNERNMGILK